MLVLYRVGMMARHRLRKTGRKFKLQIDEDVLKDFLYEALEDAKNIAVREIRRNPRTGSPRSDGERASVRGEYPHEQTGALSRSLDVKKKSNSVVYGAEAEHGQYLETDRLDRHFLAPSVFGDPGRKGAHQFVLKNLKQRVKLGKIFKLA